jgi:ceramide glucosyltransferase
MSAGVDPGVAHFVGGAFALAAWLGVLYLALASVLVIRFGRRARRLPGRPPPASILVPLCGEDAGLRERLSARCRQDYGAPVQLVCGVRDADDAAVGIVESLAAEVANVRIDLKIDPRQHGGNGKVSNLINMSPLAKAEFLAIIDSDILVDESHLSSLAGELERPGVGAVTCLYHGVGATSVWSWLAALGINADFLPNVVVALTLGAARPCFGATIALRRSTLKAIGGFRAFADCLHDDYAIGDRVRDAGYTIAIPQFTVGHVFRERSARALVQNQLRAARTIRMINPTGYAGSIIAHPVAFAIPAALLDWAHGAPLLGLAFAGRMMLCLSVEYAFSLRRQAYWLAPFSDLLFLLVYAASFFGAGVHWRGERYRLKPDGTLVHDPR